MNLEKRFWQKVEKTNDCWIWKGAIVLPGKINYGAISVKGKSRRTHRIAWELAYGPIPSNMCVCHKCDNPRCVNPQHLFLGTYADNRHDAMKKNRQAKREKHGSAKLTMEIVKYIRNVYRPYSGIRKILARRFGVCEQTISRIGRGYGWK